MSKYDKKMGIAKPSDEKRQDPKPSARKGNRAKKKYPPHWEVRACPFGGYYLDAHRVRPSIPLMWSMIEDLRHVRHDLAAYLAWYAGRFPHTADLPVRFISCQPVECGRETIPS
jgi:hypothetical protein